MKTFGLGSLIVLVCLSGGCNIVTGDNQEPEVALLNPSPHSRDVLSGSFRLAATAEDDLHLDYLRIQLYKTRQESVQPDEMVYDFTLWTEPGQRTIAVDTFLTLPEGLVLSPFQTEGHRYRLSVTASDGSNPMGIGKSFKFEE